MINKVIFSIVSVSITLIFQLGNVNAGELYNRYNHDLHILAAEQWKNPKKLIKFSDESGALLRKVLSIEIFNLVNEEINSEEDYHEKQVALSGTISPILSKYEEAFRKNGKQYEAEYLAAFKIIYTMTTTYISKKKPNFPKATDTNIAKQDELIEQLTLQLDEETKKMSLKLIEVLISKLSKQIKDGVFSEHGSLEAYVLLETIKNNSALKKERSNTK